MDSKAKPGILKSLLSFIQYFVPSQARVFDLHTGSDKLNALRALCEGKPEAVNWREGRPYILGEKVEWSDGSLAITGVVRGGPLSANRLVHLPNYGDYQISKILSAPLPRQAKSGHGGSMDVESTMLAEPDAEDADSLVSSNDPDDLANEQTWPTEEEIQEAQKGQHVGDIIPEAKKGTTPKVVRRLPKGTSEYQAAWIVDESDEEGGEDGEREGEEVEMEEEEEMVEMPVKDEDDMEMTTEGLRSVAFQDLDMEEEGRQLKDWRERKREEEDDLQFPDEIDTPMDISARVRFQRYRGLRSFRTSPWDPYENLPRDYARIFQFEDFKRTERAVKRRAEEDLTAVAVGTRVTVYLKDAPEEAAQSVQSPYIIFGLLQHEHKKSVLNFTVQRNTEYDGQHTRGGGRGANNVHKFEKFLKHGVTSVMTTYGPIAFGSQPCLLLRETNDAQAPELVATGSFLNTDTTRVVTKRIILSGHPFKVHRKTATVRYMLFNAEDVHYFKPIQLHTKHGRTGHIRESLGTHGYFKAHFDGQISQMDTVCMSLYKRVYPKWSELWREDASRGAGDDGGDQMEE
ncbi:hypothetical protein EW026_g584 [Hermanssonia centrifuga]|uniref:Uncharacterized protein n=1 Tax=Hermanssonia centrifuga TaxID=98765 RepID=A0A4S4KUU7_9APHY|nr:hypothetical protein EW026_g584 [Hermanssonia centrifuga]